MAFKISAEITLKANAAIRAIQAFEKGTKNTKKEFSLLGRTISLDTKRIKKNMMAMAAIGGAFFAGIMRQSPHVRAEFKRLEAATLLFNVALGEELQPIIALIVDGIIALQEKFLALDPDIRTIIVTTGFLSLVLIAATFAAIGLWTALGPITLAIIGIAFVFALLFTAWDKGWIDMSGTVDWFANTFGGTIDIIVGIFDSLVIIIGTVIGLLVSLFGPLIRVAIAGLEFALSGILLAFDLIIGVIDLVLAALISLFTWDMTALEDAWKRFSDAIGDDLRSIAKAFMNVIYSIVNVFIDAYNAIPGVNNISRLGSSEASNNTVSIESTVGAGGGRAEGGEIFQDGLIFAHRKERILTKSENRAGGGRGGSQGGTTIINNYNTFKIGSVDSKKRIREMMKEADRLNKRSSDRRFKV